MNKKKNFLYLSIILVIFVYLVFNFQFRTPILSGFIMAALTYPIYNSLLALTVNSPTWPSHKYLSRFFKKEQAGILTVLIISIFLYFITNYIIGNILSEIPNLNRKTVDYLQSLSNNEGLINQVSKVGITKSVFSETISNIKNNFISISSGLISVENLTKVYSISSNIISSIFSLLINLVIFLLAWYNGMVYGGSWANGIINLFPVASSDKNTIKNDLKMGIRNVIYANVISGLFNGLLCLIIMLIFGLPGAFVLAFFAFLIGFLPLTPSEVGYAIPLLMLLQINPIAALVTWIIVEIAIFMLNYWLLPNIILSSAPGNPLFIITSVITGIAFFGIMGFIIGPVIMIFINTLTQISYKEMSKSID